jgi:hypothetical protein
MSTRILHCSTSIENYNICIEQKVAGFSNRGPQPNDLVYLAVKVGKKTLCGARFRLNAPTDFKPWPDGEKYVHSLRIKDIEYCQPFDISILSQAGGKHWAMKYMQASKPISDQAARQLLDEEFSKNKVDLFVPYEANTSSSEEGAVIVPPIFTEPAIDEVPLTRDSIKIQAMLADIGERMKYSIWLPKK